MNQPGVYALHLGVLATVGAGDAAWRAFDLAWLALTAVALAAFAAPWGAVAAAGAALGFVLYHLAGGAWQAGQRDFLLCAFLAAAALGVARWLEAPTRWRSLACSGLAMGAAITVKPHAAVLATALGVLVLLTAVRGGAPTAATATVVYAVATLVAPAAALAWLAATGALTAWRQAVFEYLLPLYSRLGREAGWNVYRWPLWIPLGLAAGLAVVAAVRARRLGARHVVALVGVGYGVLHFVGQGKGWEYHLYPLATFVLALAFSGLDPRLSAARPARAALLVALAVALAWLTVKGAEASPAGWERDKVARVEAVVETLRPRLAPGDTVQVLDTSDGGAHVLLRLRVPAPTRFVYDFHFFHDVDTPIVRALRAELIRGLDARPPRFILLFEHGWPAGGYERVAAFPELAERLATRYRVLDAVAGVRVYAQRDHP
jgi:hypothetical protein